MILVVVAAEVVERVGHDMVPLRLIGQYHRNPDYQQQGQQSEEPFAHHAVEEYQVDDGPDIGVKPEQRQEGRGDDADAESQNTDPEVRRVLLLRLFLS